VQRNSQILIRTSGQPLVRNAINKPVAAVSPKLCKILLILLSYPLQVSYNAPNLMYLGWGAPNITLTRDNFPAATQLSIKLPKLGTTRNAFLIIVPDWPLPPSSGFSRSWYNMVVSYRTVGGVDPELHPWFDGAASVHYIRTVAYSNPLVIARAAPGETYVDKDSGVVIKTPAAGDGKTLTIQVCRYTVAASQCGA
jgi:hypothetical protein